MSHDAHTSGAETTSNLTPKQSAKIGRQVIIEIIVVSLLAAAIFVFFNSPSKTQAIELRSTKTENVADTEKSATIAANSENELAPGESKRFPLERGATYTITTDNTAPIPVIDEFTGEGMVHNKGFLSGHTLNGATTWLEFKNTLNISVTIFIKK